MDQSVSRPRVVVVGGGIAGLSAAYFLSRLGGDHALLDVVVLERGARVGGKLAVSEMQGVPVDDGAEALLARRPEGVDLARQVGLDTAIVPAATTSAALYSRGRQHALLRRQVQGVPADFRELAGSGLLTAAEVTRASLDLLLPRLRSGGGHDGDVSVTQALAPRLGRAVVDRLVEPLLGGVYAGRADALSLHATLPQLAQALATSRSVVGAARAARAATDRTAATAPLFVSLQGGLGRLPPAVAAASGAEVRTGVTVRELRRTPEGWQLSCGPASGPGGYTVSADAVVLAVSAPAAARLLAGVAGGAAAELAGIPYASVALVTLLLPAAAAASPGLPPGRSGFLVPAVEGRLVKGVTVSSNKWAWYAQAAPDFVVVRASLGRHGDEHVLQRDDAELIRAVRSELADLAGLREAPVGARVIRWGGALPQYLVGHLERVGRIRAELGRPGLDSLAVCGAAYDGIGVPACIASGHAAAARIADHLDRRGKMDSYEQ